MDGLGAAHQYTAQDLLERFGRTPVDLKPFPHCVLDEAFPAETGRRMAAQTLPIELMTRYEAPHQFRYYYMLDDAGLARLPDDKRAFWGPVAKGLRSAAFIEALLERFADLIRPQAAHRAPLIAKHERDGKVDVTPRLMLTADCQDFLLRPHTDGANKILTLLFYLDDGADWGTEFYTPKDGTLRTFRSDPYDKELFDLFKTVPCRANSMVCFVKTDHSWHGVDAKGLEGGRRDLMILNLEIGRRADFDASLSIDRSYLA